MRMFLRLAFQRWLELSDQKHRITLLMDEFTSWGRMPFFAQNLAVLGGRGIRTLVAVQNVPQLRDTYGHADTITEQCKVRVYFAANGQTTGQEISRQTGTGTATTVQESRQARGWSWAMWDSKTAQQQQHARPLLTDGEAMQIPETPCGDSGLRPYADLGQEAAVLSSAGVASAGGAACPTQESRHG